MVLPVHATSRLPSTCRPFFAADRGGRFLLPVLVRGRLAIGLTVAVPALPRMLRNMTPSEPEPPAVAAQPPRADGEVVAAAVALLEAAALTAAMRRVPSWNPQLHLSAAADRLWVPSGSSDQESWRTDPSKHATEFRLAVLVAQATIGRCLAEDGYLSARAAVG
jgi:hypothetical protein